MQNLALILEIKNKKTMNALEKKWMIVGAIIIFIISLPLFITITMSPLVPMPFYLIFLALFMSYGFILVLPLIYIIEFKLLYNKRNFGKIVLVKALIFAILNIYYIWASWEYGIAYQGELHTIIVTIENAICFLCLIILAYLAVLKNLKKLQYFANLFLFLLLSWCAFPYLGEMI